MKKIQKNMNSNDFDYHEKNTEKYNNNTTMNFVYFHCTGFIIVNSRY